MTAAPRYPRGHKAPHQPPALAQASSASFRGLRELGKSALIRAKNSAGIVFQLVKCKEFLGVSETFSRSQDDVSALEPIGFMESIY